ncbi:MAG: glycosyltransferase family 4 protein [Cytophagaceae bacterium]|nr:glycosyltransferase family 4 protein [Cytophagaceae bacterium]
MKVTFFNRDRRDGNYSIEELFNNLKSHLKNQIECHDYFLSGRKSKFFHIKDARKHQGDINHITGDANYLSLGLDKGKTILTIHDLGHFEVSLKGIKKIIYKYLWLYFPLRKVKYITTISEFTKQRLLANFNISPEKIIVIHNPYPKNFKFSPKEFNASKPTILQIGSGRNKNIESLIQATRSIPCKLLLVRKPDDTLIKLLKEYNIDYEFRFGLEFDEVYKCYQECDIVYFASIYEGFGLPIIEANAVGRPVITSNLASMPEIAGDAAYLIDPHQPEQIRTAIETLIHDPSVREKLISNGRTNIERFDVNLIGEKYLALYKKITNE